MYAYIETLFSIPYDSFCGQTYSGLLLLLFIGILMQFTLDIRINYANAFITMYNVHIIHKYVLKEKDCRCVTLVERAHVRRTLCQRIKRMINLYAMIILDPFDM